MIDYTWVWNILGIAAFFIVIWFIYYASTGRDTGDDDDMAAD